jgi:hypothetical protein
VNEAEPTERLPKEEVEMKRTTWLVAANAILAVSLVASGSLAQGRGMGRGRGMGMGMGMGPGMGRGAGVCQGLGPGAGAGGWWNWVTPKTDAQKAFVNEVTRLHADIRAKNLEIYTLRAQNASQSEISKKQAEVTALQARLAQVTQANQTLLRELGVPAGYGVCDGTGPKGNGLGYGRGAGWGRGNGMGLRNGTGPNPYCPLK